MNRNLDYTISSKCTQRTEKGEVLEIKTVTSAQKCLGEILDTVRRKYLFLLLSNVGVSRNLEMLTSRDELKLLNVYQRFIIFLL